MTTHAEDFSEGVRVDEAGRWADWSIPSVKCAELRKLDLRFATDPRSPLHHDQRCPIHSRHP